MGQFQNDLQLYKSLEPAARPIDTYAPIRLPSAGPQLNELAEGLSVFNRGLRKFAVEERAEFQEEERKAGEAFANQLTEADRIEIARQGIRDAEKAGLIPEGSSPTRLIAIQEAIGRELARDYEKRAFEQVARLSDPTNVEDIDEAFREEWRKTNLGNSFYITAAAVEEQTKIDNRLVRQVHAQRAANTLELNKEQHTNELEYQLDLAGTRGEVYSTKKIEAWMNEGFKQFGSSFYEEGWRAIQQEALSLAQDGKADEAIALVNSFKNANPTGQKNAGMDRRFSNEIDLFEDDIRKAEQQFEDNEDRERQRARLEEKQARDDENRRLEDTVGEFLFNLDGDIPETQTEFKKLLRDHLVEKGFAPAIVGSYETSKAGTLFESLQDPRAEEDIVAALEGARTREELRALAEELGATPIQITRAERSLDAKRDAVLSQVSRAVSPELALWQDEIDVLLDQLPPENRELRAKIIRRELGAFQAEVDRVTKEVRSNNPDFTIGEVGREVQRRMAEWNTENIGRLNNADDVNAPVNEVAEARFEMPSLSRLPAAPPGDEFTEEGAVGGFFGGRLANRVGDYFEETTAQGRERYARENVQPVIQEELKAADQAIRLSISGTTRTDPRSGLPVKIAPEPLDQDGMQARRYRSAVLFTGVSIEDLERGTFENGVTIVDELRNPKMTPFFPNKKALEDALDEYDNATADAQSGTLIGRLITELGAENTGTADQFATMQGLLLQRRGMN